MAFVAESTANPLGQRANALRGLNDGIVHYDIGGRVRTLGEATEITLSYPGTPPIVNPLPDLPIDPIFTATGTLMPPLQTVTPAVAEFSLEAWIKADSVVPKVPNWALVGLGGLAVLAFAGGGRKRGRR